MTTLSPVALAADGHSQSTVAGSVLLKSQTWPVHSKQDFVAQLMTQMVHSG